MMRWSVHLSKVGYRKIGPCVSVKKNNSCQKFYILRDIKLSFEIFDQFSLATKPSLTFLKQKQKQNKKKTKTIVLVHNHLCNL